MRISSIMQLAKQYLVLGIVLVIVLSVIFVLSYFVVYKGIMKGKKRITKKQYILTAILCCYFVIVLGATLGNRGAYFQGSFHLQPFKSYREAWNNFSIKEWRNIILNIGLFIPLGFLLPLLSNTLRKFWRTYLIGFIVTFMIEYLQLISKRGIFEIDDIIGNTVGTMIGYGVVILTIYIGNKMVHKKDESFRNIITLQIPLFLTIITFSSIFYIYSRQELGNLSIAPSYKYNMSGIHIQSDLVLSEKKEKAYVYAAKMGTQEDALKEANKLLQHLGTYVNESLNDIYDETAVYKSADNNYSVWVNYAGLTIWFTNFRILSEMGLPGLTLNEIKGILHNYGISLPEEVEFIDNGKGDYTINSNMSELDGAYVDGSLSLTVTKDETISSFRNNLISYTPYKEFEIISEQQALDQLKEGKVKLHYIQEKINTIEVKKVRLTYRMDTKGYYQPVYLFEAKIQDEDLDLMIPALK